MKLYKKTKLKPQSAENEQQCWDMLVEHVAIYPNMVLIDATRAKDESVNYRIYKGSDHEGLEILGIALLYYPSERDAIVAREHGRKIYGLMSHSNKDLPSTIATVGARMQLPKDEVNPQSKCLPYSAVSIAVPTDLIISKLNNARVDLTQIQCFVEAE